MAIKTIARFSLWPGMLVAAALAVTPAAAAFSSHEIATFANESPVVRALLERALAFERKPDQREGNWQAANLYCEASRLGSAEGQYRLGMLYAFGKGVLQNRALAASLFSLASSQGHAAAQKMLEIIDMTTTELPQCVLEAVAPERAPSAIWMVNEEQTDIVRYLATLPNDKRWVVDLVDTLAGWYEVDPKLILSIIAVESNFRPRAQSPKAAMGLMQLIPATADRFNVKNAFDATQNIKGGMAYLRWLLAYFRGDVTLAVAAYNAGEKAVDRHKGVPPYAETRQYVKKVLGLYQHTAHPYDEKLTRASPLKAPAQNR
jgi:soluble lytic murein transglycosylase-like protein